MENLSEPIAIGIAVSAALNALAAWGFVARGRRLDRQFERDAAELRRPEPPAPLHTLERPQLRLVTGEVGQ